LRGIACLLVIGSHARLPYSQFAGAVGVTVFFTLSGYLIATLLLAEHTAHGSVDFRRFYRHRAVRLLPAAAAVLTAVAVIGTLVPGYVSGASIAGTAFYIQNWVMAPGEHLAEALSHAWSLSVEEQFYLVWPLLVLLLRGNRTWLVATALAGSCASVVVRVLEWDGGAGTWRIYFGTDTRADGLLIGCALAAATYGRALRARPLLVAGCLFVIVLCPDLITEGPLPIVWAPLVLALAAAAVIWGCVHSRQLAARPLVWVGRRSYGLYLWSAPVGVLLDRRGISSWAYTAAMIVAALLLAAGSWRFIEKPIQRFRSPRERSGLRGKIDDDEQVTSDPHGPRTQLTRGAGEVVS
jgi:peptidoglycan/LPS O-acetylase OafA/YrhL